MPHSTEQDDRLVRYLLGELSEEARDRLEGEYLVNAQLHDALLAVEDELIYAYVGGRLSPSRSTSFERFFLQTPERRSRVEFARSFANFLEANPGLQSPTTVPFLWTEQSEQSSQAIAALVSGPELDRSPEARERLTAIPDSDAPPRHWKSFWTDAVAWVRKPMVGIAFATLMVTIAVLSFWGIRSTGHTEVAQNPPSISTKDDQPSKAASPVPPSSPAVGVIRKAPKLLAFTLLATERSSGEGNLLTIPPGDYLVRLRLQPFGDVYPNYRATLTTPEQRTVTRGQVRGRPPQRPYVEFASTFLAGGDYILRLYGVDGSGPGAKHEELAAYAFRVVHEQPK